MLEKDLCITKKERWVALGIITAIFTAIIVVTGSLMSGYHLVDDHEMFQAVKQLKSQSVFSLCVDSVVMGLSNRFRPLYNIERTLEAAILGTHFRPANIVKFFEGIFTTYLIYIMARKMKMNRLWAALFDVIVVIGPQFICWSRVANQENTGLLLITLAMYYLVLAVNEDDVKKARWYRLWAVFWAVCMSLFKEAFVLFLPALYLFEVCLVEQKEDSGFSKKWFINRLFNPLKNHPVSWIILGITCLLELWTIIFVVGTESVDYVGISQSTPVREYLEGIWFSINNDCFWGILLIIGAVTVIVAAATRHGNIIWKKSAFKVLLCGYIIVSQMALHAKVTMFERYLVPWSIGVAVVAVWNIFGLREYLKDIHWYGHFQVLMLIAIIGLVIRSYDYTIDWVNKSVVGSGKLLTEALEYTNEGDRIALYGFTPEEELSVRLWLEDRGYTPEAMNEEELVSARPETIITGGLTDIDVLKLAEDWSECYTYVWTGQMHTIYRKLY